MNHFANSLDRSFHFNDQPTDDRVIRFGPDGIGLAKHFLRQEIKLATCALFLLQKRFELLQVAPQSHDLFRDIAPWVYEAGMEAYRAFRTGNETYIQAAIQDFKRTSELTFRSPLGRELFGGRAGREYMMYVEELPMLLHEFLDIEAHSKRPPRTKSPKD